MASTAPFVHVTLTEEDVPGAKFAYHDIESHSNIQLKRWLECRGLAVGGNRTLLLERVKKCCEAGKQDEISIAVDQGKWYQLKFQSLSQQPLNDQRKVLPPITGWNLFPSTNLPSYLNAGHLHHYFVESIQFLGDADSDEDIDDLHTSKPLARGRQLFKSGHVQNLKDVRSKQDYFIKSKVMSSYHYDVFYDVCINVSYDTGFVCDAACSCVASAMGRCSHVAAVLFALLDYIDNFGCDQVSCTSKLCNWNLGRKRGKNPDKIFASIYPGIKSRKINSVVDYDPLPPSFRTPVLEANSENILLFNLQAIPETDGGTSMWETLLSYKYQDFTLDNEQCQVLKKQRSILLENLSVPYNQPNEIVYEQGCDEWFRERRVRVTASICKSVCTARVASIGTLLYNILWQDHDNKTYRPILYGKENETLAMEHYLQIKQDSCEDYKLTKSGFWINPDFPELGCSPDGIANDPDMDVDFMGLLEIKCPYVLRDHPIEAFEEVLSKQQLSRFCLSNQSGETHLKRNHEYYFQVQMQLGVMGLKWCDFVVWSPQSFFMERVNRDVIFWESMKKKLLTFHHSWLCPEFFEQRLPRELPPFHLPL